MKKAPVLPNDAERVKALKGLQILDTSPEVSFDQITELAASICDVKIALVSLVDDRRQWFKAKYGLSVSETPREISFCGHAIAGSDVFEVRDAALHPDFCDNPLVLGEPKVRFYAGAPLVTSDGFRLGTLCVIDSQPSRLDERKKRSLELLAKQVVTLLEARLDRQAANSLFSQLQEAQRIAHVGSWSYDLRTQEQFWSSEHYRIFEIPEPQPQESLWELYRQRIHPEDLPELDRLAARALKDGEGFVYNHRVYLDGGARIKFVQGIGRVTKTSDGKPAFISGTCRDRTDDVENENRYHDLIESMSEGLLVRNASGAVIQVNQAAKRILGLSEAQICGREPLPAGWRLDHEDGRRFEGWDDPSSVKCRTLGGEGDWILSLKASTDDRRWIRLHVFCVEAPAGKTTTWMMSDITAMVQAREEYRFVLETLGIGVWRYYPQAKKLHWNSTAHALFESDPSQFSGSVEAWEQALAPDGRKTAIEQFEQALRTQAQFFMTFEILTPSGKRKHLGARGTVVRNESGEAVLMVGVNWDRSNEVKMETFLQQERQNAIQNSKLASLGEMAAGIAHEINNPLAVIQANAFLLPRIKGDEQKFTDRLGAMTKATERIAKIVKGLRKFSRSTEGAEHRPERVTDIVNECLVLTEAKAKRHSVTIDAKLESQKQILCDQVEIEQVLVNLINNAIDAVSELPERWVVVSSLDEGDEVLIRVMDSGKGVPAEVEDKIFQPFFTTKSVGQGTGLGLSIARGILEQHGATLMLNRSLGHTCFEIRFKKKDA